MGPSAEAAPAVFWTKLYPVREFGMFWHLDLEVKSGSKARKKLLSLMKKQEGFPQQPIENLPVGKDYAFQQFSFRMDKKKAQAAAEELKRQGKVLKFTQKDNPLPAMSDDIQIKLSKLSAEREAGRAALAQLPSIAAAADEILANLQTAFISYRDSSERVLFNIVIVQSKP